MRQFLMTMAFVVLTAGQAIATADGPDFWRVTGVAADDVLNVRAGPSARDRIVGTLAPDANGLANLGCVGWLSQDEWQRASKAEREAARRRTWCLIGHRRMIGWVAHRFLAEGDGRNLMAGRTGVPGWGQWQLNAFADGTTAKRVGMRLAGPGEVSGNTGCNRFRTTVSETGRGIAFGPLAMTRKACPEPERTVERRVVAMLASVRLIAVSGHTMAFLDGKNRLLATFGRRDWD